MKLSWYPSAAVDAAAAHVGWGIAIVLGVGRFLAPQWAVGVLAVWVALKEGIFDLVVEQDSEHSSAVDAAQYAAGGLIGLILLLL